MSPVAHQKCFLKVMDGGLLSEEVELSKTFPVVILRIEVDKKLTLVSFLTEQYYPLWLVFLNEADFGELSDEEICQIRYT